MKKLHATFDVVKMQIGIKLANKRHEIFLTSKIWYVHSKKRLVNGFGLIPVCIPELAILVIFVTFTFHLYTSYTIHIP